MILKAWVLRVPWTGVLIFLSFTTSRISIRVGVTEEEGWHLLSDAYEEWYHGLTVRTKPFYERHARTSPIRPSFSLFDPDKETESDKVTGSLLWWHCMIVTRIRHLKLAKSKHRDISYNAPEDLSILPALVESGSAKTNEDKDLRESDGEESKKPVATHALGDEGEDGSSDDATDGEIEGGEAAKVPPRKFFAEVSLPCGYLPRGSTLERYHDAPDVLHKRDAESRYARGFVEHSRPAQPRREDVENWMSTAQAQPLLSAGVCASDGVHAALCQKKFFQEVDDLQRDWPLDGDGQSSGVLSGFEATLENARKDFPKVVPSSTSVMEAAFSVVRANLLRIPDVGTINVKQARAFLWVAAWLQSHMCEKWKEDGKLFSDTPSSRRSIDDFVLALVGPGGTGKTGVLKVAEAFINHFVGAESVRKCAPSNTAARLLGGDTLHALCKLPFGNNSLRTKQGRLSGHVLEKHQNRWRTAAACFLDEISMTPPEQIHQASMRMSQAKRRLDTPFGGLGVVVCGDFLQLPPIEKAGSKSKRSLAHVLEPPNAEGVTPAGEAEKVKTKEDKVSSEARQSSALWRSVRRVVGLTVNVRAPGVLSRLQAEMRDGHISDEMWQLYLSRVLQPDDPRLRKVPFGSEEKFGDVTWIVHRHRLRVIQSFQNAKLMAKQAGQQLYVVQASDVVVEAKNEHKFTPELRQELLRMCSFDKTKCLPSFLPLFLGMKMILNAKASVRFKLMKGCVCTLVDILFADDEDLLSSLPGEPTSLRYLPAGLLLRVEGAVWKLPLDELPPLKDNVDRRGLFFLRPSCDYIRVGEKDGLHLCQARLSHASLGELAFSQ